MKRFLSLVLILSIILTASVFAADILYPNAAGKSITIPSAMGAYGNRAFVAMGLVIDQPYGSSSQNNDANAVLGYGIGNPYKDVGVSITAMITDLSDLNDYTFGFHICKYLGEGWTAGIGGEKFAHIGAGQSTVQSYYLVFSHAHQDKKSDHTHWASKVHYSIGIGSGRFYEAAEQSVNAGKPQYGTAVFAGFSYEIHKHVNVNLEWSGLDASAGISFPINFIKIKGHHLTTSIGILNFTNRDADRTSYVISVGSSFGL